MSEYIPSTQLRAGSSTTAADFIAGIDDTLGIDSLVTRFSQALGLQAASHACYAVGDGERRFLFGATGWCGPGARPQVLPQISSAARRVGKECVCTWLSGWGTAYKKKNNRK